MNASKPLGEVLRTVRADGWATDVIMSYRAFKRLLGETSLERKCRFLFGAGILVLITLSFWLYAYLTEQLAYNQAVTTCRLLVFPILAQHHVPYLRDKTGPLEGAKSSSSRPSVCRAAAISIGKDSSTPSSSSTRTRPTRNSKPSTNAT